MRRDQPLNADARPWRNDPRWDEVWTGRRARRRTRRRRPIGRTILIVFLLLVIATLGGTLLLWTRVAAFNDQVSTAPALSSALFLPLGADERVNVLMVGYGGGDHDGAYLADSINILSIDPSTETTTTIPIPRDLWIEGFAQLPDNAKVNEVFAIGADRGGVGDGAQMLAELLGGVTGLRIDHWMAIDFTGFREMVDAVGGITINNPTAFSYTGNPQLHDSGVWTDGTFAAGEIQLDGTQALAYARARYTSEVSESSDFARSVRQQAILSGLKAKVGEGGIGSIGPGLGLMDALEERLTTSLSAIDLFLLSGHLNSDRRVPLAEDEVLVATTNTIGQYILIPAGWTGPGDYGGLQAWLAAALAEPVPHAAPSAGIP